MARVPDKDLIRLHGWPEGINNLDRETDLPMGKAGAGGKVSGQLRVAENLDLDDEGKPSRRDGYEQVEALSELHSLYANKRFPLMLGVYDGQLVAWDSSETRTALTTLRSRTAAMSYDYDAGWVYFTNGFDSGRVNADGDVQPWALLAPTGQPNLAAAATGGLAAGLYQVAVTYLDADGRESGSTLATEVELTTGQGLALSAIPQPVDASVTTVRIYATEANGEVLYFARDLPVGVTAVTIGVHVPGESLQTQFHEPLPAGQIVRLYRGTMYVVRGNLLYWSEPLHYGQGRLFDNYLTFQGDGTLLEGVHVDGAEGMFAAFGKRTYYLAGTNPKDWIRAIAHPYGAVLGACQADAKALGQDADGELPYWLDANGQFVLGLPNGRVQTLHAERYAAPVNAEAAAIVLRESGGMRQLLATVRGGTDNPLAIGDRVEAEVWKNGVRIS